MPEREDNLGPDPAMNGLDDLILKAFDAPDTSPQPRASKGAATAVADDEATDDSDLSVDDADDLPEDVGEEDLEEQPLDEDEDEEYEEEEDADEEYEEDEEEEEDEDVEDVLENVTAEDLERIEDDPTLKKLHRQMQRDYSKKTMDLADKTKTVEAREKEIESLENDLVTAEGMSGFLSDLWKRRPDVVGVAFEQVATGENRRDFLIEVGLQDPDVMEEAYEQLQDLLSDESAKARYVKERDFNVRQAELDKREAALKKQTFNKHYDGLITAAEKEAKKLGIHQAHLEELHQRMKEKMRGQVRSDGSIMLDARDAKEVTRDFRKALDRLKQTFEQENNRSTAKKTQQATKEKARKAASRKGRVAPRQKARKQPKETTKFVPDSRQDPIDAYIDHQLGL